MLFLQSHHQQMLLLLLLVVVAAFHGDSSGATATYDLSMCLSEPYTCGGVSFSYPFYLSRETTKLNGYQNSSCGYPGLGILCDDGKPILQLGGAENYTVKSNDGATATLVDAEVVGVSCPRVDHNVTLPQGAWLDYPATAVVFFLGCNFAPGVQPPAMEPITCKDFVSGLSGQSFVLPAESVPQGNWSRECGRVIEVPVLKYDPVDPKDYTWRSTGYGEVLSQGFNVSWENDRPGECTRCEGTNGRCAYDQTGGFLGCL